MGDRVTQAVRRHGDTAMAVVLVGLVIAQVWALDLSMLGRVVTTAGAL